MGCATLAPDGGTFRIPALQIHRGFHLVDHVADGSPGQPQTGTIGKQGHRRGCRTSLNY